MPNNNAWNGVDKGNKGGHFAFRNVDKATAYSFRLISCIELGMWPQVWENLTVIAKLCRFLVDHHVRDIVLGFPADSPAPEALSNIYKSFLNERKSYVRLANKIVPGVTTNAQILELWNRTAKPEYRWTHAEWTALRSHQSAIAPPE